MLIALAALSLLIWIYLLLARGGFWRVSQQLAKTQSRVVAAKRVAVVIPARNEADVIGESITSLLEQEFPAPLDIFLVDDSSTDGTANAARRAAERAGQPGRLTIIRGKPLPPGWTGKMWAVSQGAARALELGPDYLLFTDADIRHGRTNVAQLVAAAEAGNYDLASYMVLLACQTRAEKALIPAFVFFFLMLYPPAWIASRRFRTAGAAGGCILVRPEALRKAGGIENIRKEVIDDCALARAVKRSGGRLWMGLTHETQSIRSYGGFREIGRMIARTAFNQLHHSAWLLIVAVAGLLVTYVLPVVLLFMGKPLAGILSAATWLLMAACYFPMVRFYRRSFLWSFALPGIALFYLGATVYSAFQYWRGLGGNWKGRVQDVRPAPLLTRSRERQRPL